MARALKRYEIREAVVAFFEEEGKVLNIREYNEAYKAGRAPHSLAFVEKHLGNYKKVVRMLQRQDSARLGAIGTKAVEKPAEEPASENDLSPLERLRSIKGESSE